jgi:hypothetical protein
LAGVIHRKRPNSRQISGMGVSRQLDGFAQLPVGALSSSDSDTHIDDLAAQVGNVLADVFGTELVWRTVYCANDTPMLSEHGCERLLHDQPIVFSRS